ncbi:MAG: 4Fe-4S dicluster domain-containing protein [Candidatus Stahlbacteria bacterium]|nr:4Fe-4S dicluster domain-containing protein [Candidatus Stahlbacteria bacterium]
MNNPITGIAQFTDTVPVIKTTKEIWVQNIADLPLDKHCIRCGFCVEACSIGLLPKMIVDYMMSGKMEKAKELGLMDCIECANCAFVCPAKRNLIHWIMYGKAKLYASGGNRTHITSSGG